MYRKGNCYDNGIIEDFFGIKKRLVNFDSNDTYEVNLAKAIWFVYFYRERPQFELGGIHPTMLRMKISGKDPCLN